MKTPIVTLFKKSGFNVLETRTQIETLITKIRLKTEQQRG